MFRWPALVSLLLGAAVAQEIVIRVDVSLVRILATVKDPGGDRVGTLERGDFEVLDNGVPQEIAVFERQTEQPLSVAVLVDTSGSTAKDLKIEVESVSRFFKALFGGGRRDDMAALYSFNWQITRHNYFTRNLRAFEASLRTLKGEAGTSLYDAMYLASQDLEERDGRRVVVLVTDGGNTTSSKGFHAALEAAQIADAVIYPILITPITNEAGRNIGGENALTLMAQATGGRIFTPDLGSQLDAAFSDVLSDLRTQYLLGYYPRGVPPSKDRFHHLTVRVGKPHLRVQARTGYYGVSEHPAPAGGRISVAPEGKKEK